MTINFKFRYINLNIFFIINKYFLNLLLIILNIVEDEILTLALKFQQSILL